jgi:hypothetical protein
VKLGICDRTGVGDGGLSRACGAVNAMSQLHRRRLGDEGNAVPRRLPGHGRSRREFYRLELGFFYLVIAGSVVLLGGRLGL